MNYSCLRRLLISVKNPTNSEPRPSKPTDLDVSPVFGNSFGFTETL